MYVSKDTRYTLETLWTSTDIKLQVTRYNLDIPEAKVTRYTSAIRSSQYHLPPNIYLLT